ncbi:MAG: hypothetical protein LLG01_01970 [Planctomycetaceae bacterium]|nr:hypothetical protein [Planctomycetaceae bacterium]
MRQLFCWAVLTPVFVMTLGCASEHDLTWYRDFYYQHCEDMAWNYREGHYERVSLYHMEKYFEDRVGKMTVAELKDLMGVPRVVPPTDGYYRDALASLYGQEIEDNEDWKGGNKHDLVLHYGEGGPPHSIPDESLNLFFAAKNGVIVSVWMLAP